MTKEEFEQELRAWAAGAAAEMRAKISGGTHGSGFLEKKLKYQVKESLKESSHFIGFNFRKYGVFVHYGVGRGWVRQGNTVVRGSRVKKGSDMEAYLKSKGYSRRDIRKYVVGGSGSSWVRQGNTVVRGSRVKKTVVRGSRVKKGSDMEAHLKSKGYSRRDIREYVVGGSGSSHGRKPVDWFDSVLRQHMEELADIAQEYYGDYSQERLAEMIDRMTIGKGQL